MAPRKTTKTAVEAAPSEDVQVDVRTLEQSEQLGAGHAGLIITSRLDTDVARDQRFQVALAIWPTMYPYMGDDEHQGDENRAGALARKAFEFADAFIAQSKKGLGDAG